LLWRFLFAGSTNDGCAVLQLSCFRLMVEMAAAPAEVRLVQIAPFADVGSRSMGDGFGAGRRPSDSRANRPKSGHLIDLRQSGVAWIDVGGRSNFAAISCVDRRKPPLSTGV
jgi:hypothetical protein